MTIAADGNEPVLLMVVLANAPALSRNHAVQEFFFKIMRMETTGKVALAHMSWITDTSVRKGELSVLITGHLS